ncbi:hypothetical protein D5F01_LYC23296 [Larimichthys crocea]|uniref:Immunoglobulin V-set domain-containing protein n=1 Tax=Larimichthys crocea TaxID=215358 RepID=A0A6G0HGS0_LARCR|nr:hypothetical protein D5F01_LYC23296 [Larimichthys crocea]
MAVETLLRSASATNSVFRRRRFKLVKQNQTVLLHLTNLTSEDSGSYTCECSDSGGTYVLHLNITVEEDDDASSSAQILTLIPSVLIGTGIVIMIMIAGVILGLICKRICCGKYQLRDGSRSTTSGLPVSETPLDQDDPDDPYTSLQRPENDVYQTISNPAANTVTVDSDNSDSKDEDASNSTQTQTLIPSVLIGAAIVVMIAGVILGLFYRQIRHSKQPQPQSSPPNMDPGDIEPYSTFIRRESGLYSTVRVNCSNTNTNNSKMFTREDTHAGKSL